MTKKQNKQTKKPSKAKTKQSNTWKTHKKQVLLFIEGTKTEQEFHDAVATISQNWLRMNAQSMLKSAASQLNKLAGN